jgi:uncharacterized protein (TIRG00374 family)
MKKWIPRVIGPVILAIILFHLDFGTTIAALRQASAGLLILAYLMFIPSLFFRTVRWRVLMAPQKIHLSFWESFSVYALSISVGVVTPGRFGELIKGLYLRSKGNSLGSSFFSVFLDRLSDIVFLLIFGCWALSSFVAFGVESSAGILWIILGVSFGMIMLWVVTRGRGNEAVTWLLRAAFPRSLKDRMTTEYQDFSEGFTKTKPRTLGGVFVLTALAWGANYWGIYLFGLALGFDIKFLVMAGIAAICALVSLVPISVMGVGTRDAVLILMLGKYGISEAGAVAFSTLILSMLVFNGLICSFSLLTPAVKFDWRSQIDQAKT